MRQSNQESQCYQTKTQYSILPNMNVIKITPFGYQTLSNSHDWACYKNDTHKNYGIVPANKIKLIVPTEPIEDINCKQKKAVTFYFKKRTQSSRKAKRAYDIWTKSQQQISTNIQKQLNKRINEKSKQYEWPKISSQIKKSITSILGEWKNSESDEKDRVKYRLKNIYNRKYKKDRENGKQNKKLSKKPHVFFFKSEHQNE